MTELEQRANDEARHAHRELIETLTERAETAEALLAEAVEELETIDAKISWELNPSNYNHEQVCNMNSDWCEIGEIATATLAKIKGETNDE